jgi:MOSC domain-containing protein YiiM
MSSGKTGWCGPGLEAARERPAHDALPQQNGDGQEGLAGHGGEQRAVLVYQIESYRFGRRVWAGTIWSRTILVRTSRSTACPTTVCVGDGYRIGDVVFEVTQPRSLAIASGYGSASRGWPLG